MEQTRTALHILWMLLRRSRRRVPTHVSRIAIVYTAKLGDMVCLTPVFRALRSRYPDATITLFGIASNKELVAGNTDISEYVVFDQALVSTYRDQFDIGLVPAPNVHALSFLTRIGARMILVPTVVDGWSPHETRWYKIFSFFVRTVPHNARAYAPGEYLKMLEPLGIHATDTTKYLFVTSDALVKAQEILAQSPRPRIGIVPSAGNKIKTWPAERFALVSDAISNEMHGTPVCLGGPRDTVEVDAYLAACQKKSEILNLAGTLGIEELKAVVHELDAVVAADTGIIYVAEAFGVPTVDIVGPVDEAVQPPRGPRHRAVTPPYARIPQMNIMNARVMDKAEARRQAESITVPQVYAALREVLAR